MPRKIKVLWVICSIIILMGFIVLSYQSTVEKAQEAAERHEAKVRQEEKKKQEELKRGALESFNPIKEIRELNALGKYKEAIELAEIAAAAKTIQQMGVHQVLISLGKQGVLWAGEEQNWLVDTPQIEEKNPIGAGDSLLGGVVWGLAQGLPPEEAIRWGVASGAATAAQSGTAVGTREEVERLLGQVRMQPQKS